MKLIVTDVLRWDKKYFSFYIALLGGIWALYFIHYSKIVAVFFSYIVFISFITIIYTYIYINI